jgi:hypothetical protein
VQLLLFLLMLLLKDLVRAGSQKPLLMQACERRFKTI